ncbi:sigma factor G inhibitor Gin [Clostridium tyrobutyricum]|uniref:sigma factor G inhibitor Gin n=1 Tax=Clostridium tyrobutyricum TaxID=1519 RepID=UPI001C38EE5C|nr:sigma factor G inhibitor Gin [Clostridium tyrobutyricum]MBV4418847.1 sigma factor G inhibitor Gin [Clostridium tyrobutyricum]
MNKKRCIICGRPLNDGIIIDNRGICKLCEERLINVKHDTDFYKYYKTCIKRFIVPLIIREEEWNCQNYHF